MTVAKMEPGLISFPPLRAGPSLMIVLAVVIVCFFLYKTVAARNEKSPSLPPGPKPLPFLGNIHEMLRKPPLDCFRDWHNEFGPIITLRYGQRLVISISSHRICQELLDKRGAIYSSRPRFIIAGERMTNAMTMALVPYNDRWKSHSRIISPLLDNRAVQRYSPLEDLESKQVLVELLDGRSLFLKSLSRFSASMLFSLAYGEHLDHRDREEPEELERINEKPFEALGNLYCQLVELFPTLDALPAALAPWKSVSAEAESQTAALYLKNLERGRASAAWNFCKEAAQSKAGRQMSDKELAYVVGSVYQAGYEATLTSARLIVKAIVLYPDCARRAREELDRVVGPDRLPRAEDQSDLPYVRAMVSEAMRWQPPAPFSIPHATTQDDEYLGYRIPKGAMVIPNTWTMVFDPQEFPDPYEFRPDRWLDKGAAAEVPHTPFGYGRRRCPGRHLAFSSLSLLTSRLLWAFDITHAYKDGEKVEFDPWDLKFAFTASSKPHEASFQVRSQRHQSVIEREWNDTDRNIDSMLDKMKPDRCTE
ncbi:Fumitremorgin C synthase-like protein [Hapsidospora chrysogenum ATCC 11550]|uniref:Fumitremorgin C synthase-like protein n=1 Tax=Hapsidospora chrysogenum (strain ATCC 11550 / CBS 779.69 / DSM 880 / IAM 14645 / JCM 23072 / IMI 49137) TaxID=857340 RepID=A0A086T020_HAPC1|nr:Fumitremorgin C synthase-like protein [Hapsidospora chrysogenum ATCC 11550]